MYVRFRRRWNWRKLDFGMVDWLPMAYLLYVEYTGNVKIFVLRWLVLSFFRSPHLIILVLCYCGKRVCPFIDAKLRNSLSKNSLNPLGYAYCTRPSQSSFHSMNNWLIWNWAWSTCLFIHSPTTKIRRSSFTQRKNLNQSCTHFQVLSLNQPLPTTRMY